MPEHRKAYETSLDAQLAKWKADIDVLKAKAARAEVDAKIRYDQTLTTLESAYADASARLRALKEASDDAWGDLKAGTEKAWATFTSHFNKG